MNHFCPDRLVHAFRHGSKAPSPCSNSSPSHHAATTSSPLSVDSLESDGLELDEEEAPAAAEVSRPPLSLPLQPRRAPVPPPSQHQTQAIESGTRPAAAVHPPERPRTGSLEHARVVIRELRQQLKDQEKLRLDLESASPTSHPQGQCLVAAMAPTAGKQLGEAVMTELTSQQPPGEDAEGAEEELAEEVSEDEDDAQDSPSPAAHCLPVVAIPPIPQPSCGRVSGGDGNGTPGSAPRAWAVTPSSREAGVFKVELASRVPRHTRLPCRHDHHLHLVESMSEPPCDRRMVKPPLDEERSMRAPSPGGLIRDRGRASGVLSLQTTHATMSATDGHLDKEESALRTEAVALLPTQPLLPTWQTGTHAQGGYLRTFQAARERTHQSQHHKQPSRLRRLRTDSISDSPCSISCCEEQGNASGPASTCTSSPHKERCTR